MNIQSVNTLPPTQSAPRVVAAEATAASAKESVVAAPQSQPQQPPQPTDRIKPSDEQLKTAVKAANDFIQPFNDRLQFSIDKDSGTTIVKVIDTNTKEVIRQFPSEEMLAIAKGLDQMTGLLVKQKA
jgi:flagellar protein FlaG